MPLNELRPPVPLLKLTVLEASMTRGVDSLEYFRPFVEENNTTEKLPPFFDSSLSGIKFFSSDTQGLYETKPAVMLGNSDF